VICGWRDLLCKDFGQREKRKISEPKSLIDFLYSTQCFSLTTERQYLQFDRAVCFSKSHSVDLLFLHGQPAELCIATIYPKSRFCTKQHKMLILQGFSVVFKPLARKAEKRNCKFEPQKCNSVFEH